MENQKRYNKSQSPVIIIDSYVVGAADIMRTLLSLNEESLFVCFGFFSPLTRKLLFQHRCLAHSRYSVNNGYYFEIQ